MKMKLADIEILNGSYPRGIILLESNQQDSLLLRKKASTSIKVSQFRSRVEGSSVVDAPNFNIRYLYDE